MITKMTGVLTRVLDDEVRLEVGPFEYQLLVPEAVRRVIQLRTGVEITFGYPLSPEECREQGIAYDYEAIFGGCMLPFGDDPTHGCLACDHRWREPPGPQQ